MLHAAGGAVAAQGGRADSHENGYGCVVEQGSRAAHYRVPRVIKRWSSRAAAAISPAGSAMRSVVWMERLIREQLA
jgi:hypothetical protein